MSALYYHVFLDKYCDLPRTLTVAWDWNSFFTLIAYIASRVCLTVVKWDVGLFTLVCASNEYRISAFVSLACENQL